MRLYLISLPIHVYSDIQLDHVMGNVVVGRVGQEALQETVAGPVFRRTSEDYVLCGFA